ncbi:MAG TPA: hypothetical protein ACQGQH_01515 [Xylella sp.]
MKKPKGWQSYHLPAPCFPAARTISPRSNPNLCAYSLVAMPQQVQRIWKHKPCQR